MNRYSVSSQILKNQKGSPFLVYTVWDREAGLPVAHYHRRYLARNFAKELNREARLDGAEPARPTEAGGDG